MHSFCVEINQYKMPRWYSSLKADHFEEKRSTWKHHLSNTSIHSYQFSKTNVHMINSCKLLRPYGNQL